MTAQKKMQRRPVTKPLAYLKNDLEPVYGSDTGVYTVDTQDKHAGQPTLYKPEYCDKVIEWGKQGFSKTEMASELDVSRTTIFNWAAEHEEFLNALLVAMTHSEAWHETKARRALDLPSSAFNAGLWGKSMSARFPATYRDTTRTEHSGPDGAPIPVEIAAAPLTGEGLKDYYKQFVDRSRRNGLPV